MGEHRAPATPSRRFPPVPESVARARRFVRDALSGAVPEDAPSPEDARGPENVPAPQDAPGLVDTAKLLVSELVTNALLHARTEIEVSVRTAGPGGRVRVAVRDGRPSRVLVPQECPPYAGTGQGLALIARLAARYGVDAGDEAKAVWCELGPDGTPPSSAWGLAPPAAASAPTVTLVDVPGALYSAAQQHRHLLLRELELASAAGADLVPRPDLVTAHDVSNAISGAVAAALRHESAEGEIRSLPLALPADVAPAVETLGRVLEAAEQAARDERLLALPALPRSRVFHRWLFDEITGQLAGAHPTAWTVVPREPGAGPAELVPWDAAPVQTSRAPTIAADEQNRIIAVNGPAADLLGWHADELVGQRLTAIIPEHLRERHITAFTSLLLSGEPRILGRSVPLPALHHDGSLVPVRLFLQTQETADGRTVFVGQLSPRAAVPSGSQPRRPGDRRPAAARPEAGGPRADEVPPALDRESLLAETGAAISNAYGLDDVLQKVCQILTRRLADWCAVDLFTEDGRVERACVVHRDAGAPHAEDFEGTLPPLTEAARGPLARALSGAGPLLLTEPPSPEAEGALDADFGGLFARLGARSAVVTPLRARQETIGALTVARTGADGPFTEEYVPLVDELGRAMALGVDNARLYHDTRNIAERLQRSLLPVLPEVPHLDLAARYAASSATAQVGGDWYDGFVLPSGGTALVIGDVTGHNLDAAIAMSRLQSMLRGIAVDRQEPPETVLRRLDMANHTLHQEATATCVYGVIKGPEEGPWDLVHSSAGHLPPLLVTDDGHARFLEDGAGLLLGMDPDMMRASAHDAVPANATVLLYTDGLIERRDESLTDALERLRLHAAGLAREPLDVFCDELLIGLGADSTDDIAILAARPTRP
ncbi:SpoIIE family protein phosphatase [Streptomyces sp. NPDC057854]|uniref:SpoIIE family protein phosphatase n=1 Tax=unclassified Streptomyces TaxID=2593676 RepID=UPI0036A8C167